MKNTRNWKIILVGLSLVFFLGACGDFKKEVWNSGEPKQEQESSRQESLGTESLGQEELIPGSSSQEDPSAESLEQENLASSEQKRLEQERALQEARHSALAELLKGKIFLEIEEEEKAPFAEWLLSVYGMDAWEEADFSKEAEPELLNRLFYHITGKSLHVLWDTYTGVLADAQTATASSIYCMDTENDSLTVTLAGDICLTEDGYVIDHYDESDGGLESCISEEILERLKNAEISMINHEYPASTRGQALAGKYYTFRADPERDVLLQQMGIDLVSLSNNHIYDFGPDAFYDTLETLRQLDIPYVGAGKDLEEAARPVYFILNGMKIGFAAANRSEVHIYTPEAGEASPGVLRMYDTTRMNEVLRQASAQCDYLIAYVHWGKEDSKYYQDYQTDIAREFFASGADAIIGSHPHVLQGIGYVEDKPVVYSLGDFWFNGETKYTTLVSLKITIDGLQELSFLPCRQEGYETHYLTEAAEQEAFFDYLRKLSPGVEIDEAGRARAAIQ